MPYSRAAENPGVKLLPGWSIFLEHLAADSDVLSYIAPLYTPPQAAPQDGLALPYFEGIFPEPIKKKCFLTSYGIMCQGQKSQKMVRERFGRGGVGEAGAQSSQKLVAVIREKRLFFNNLFDVPFLGPRGP